MLARFHRTQVCIRSRGRGCTGGSFTSQAGLPGIIKEFFTVSSGIVTNRPSALSFGILCLILRETLDVSRHDPNVVGNRTSRSRSPHDETAPTGNLGRPLSKSNHLPMWSELSYQVMSSSGVSRTSSEIMIQQTIDWPGLLTYAYDSLPALTTTLFKLET